jgi:hypothetical protein
MMASAWATSAPRSNDGWRPLLGASTTRRVNLGEVLERAEHRVGRSLAQPAPAGGLHRVGELGQIVEVGLLSAPGENAIDAFLEQHVAHAAGRAVAAALVDEELQIRPSDLQQVALRAEHGDRAPGGQVVVADAAVELRGPTICRWGRRPAPPQRRSHRPAPARRAGWCRRAPRTRPGRGSRRRCSAAWCRRCRWRPSRSLNVPGPSPESW